MQACGLRRAPLAGCSRQCQQRISPQAFVRPAERPRSVPPAASIARHSSGAEQFNPKLSRRSRYAEELGYDWVGVSEHHYSPRILTPSLPIAAAYIASHVPNIKIALLGPIVPQSNPVLLAEEMAMLDTMAEGRLIVGMRAAPPTR